MVGCGVEFLLGHITFSKIVQVKLLVSLVLCFSVFQERAVIVSLFLISENVALSCELNQFIMFDIIWVVPTVSFFFDLLYLIIGGYISIDKETVF